MNTNWSDSLETLNLAQNQWYLSLVTLKFDGWPWKKGRLFYATSRFEHHFVAICEPKLELQSEKSQFGSKSIIFFSGVTLKFDEWPWKTIGYLFYATSNLMHHFIAICELKMEIQSWNAQFGKSMIFLAVWPWNLTDDLENQYSTSLNIHQALCIISSPYLKSN